MYTALDLAKYIVSKCISDNCAINNITLQKLLFYIQKNFLSRDKYAFFDEFEAWGFGPAVPNVYYHFGGYGGMAITDNFDKITAPPEDKNIIDQIIEEKRQLAFWETAAEICQKDKAWDLVYDDGKGNRRIIPTRLIKKEG